MDAKSLLFIVLAASAPLARPSVPACSLCVQQERDVRYGDVTPSDRSRANAIVWTGLSEEGGIEMARKRHTAEEIIGKLRAVEVELAKGQSAQQACRKLGMTEQTYYRWRKEYGGLRLDQAKRLKELERENARLKRVVADQALDMAILKEAAAGNS